MRREPGARASAGMDEQRDGVGAFEAAGAQQRAVIGGGIGAGLAGSEAAADRAAGAGSLITFCQ